MILLFFGGAGRHSYNFFSSSCNKFRYFEAYVWQIHKPLFLNFQSGRTHLSQVCKNDDLISGFAIIFWGFFMHFVMVWMFFAFSQVGLPLFILSFFQPLHFNSIDPSSTRRMIWPRICHNFSRVSPSFVHFVMVWMFFSFSQVGLPLFVLSFLQLLNLNSIDPSSTRMMIWLRICHKISRVFPSFMHVVMVWMFFAFSCQLSTLNFIFLAAAWPQLHLSCGPTTLVYYLLQYWSVCLQVFYAFSLWSLI